MATKISLSQLRNTPEGKLVEITVFEGISLIKSNSVYTYCKSSDAISDNPGNVYTGYYYKNKSREICLATGWDNKSNRNTGEGGIIFDRKTIHSATLI